MMKAGVLNVWVTSYFNIPCSYVRYSFCAGEGLEPPCLTAPDPKSGMSTNFTTPAFKKFQNIKNPNSNAHNRTGLGFVICSFGIFLLGLQM